MSDLQAFPEEMTGMSSTLDGSADELDAMGRAPIANAGESIAFVADLVAKLSQASAAVSAGLHEGAADVRASRDEYVRADGRAADGMPGQAGR